MNTEYIDILVLASVDATELAGRLHHPGWLGVWEDQDRIHVYWEKEHWTSDTHTILLQALTHLHLSDPTQYIRVNTLPWQDWNAQWARLVRPVRIGQHILIRPSWYPTINPPADIELIIDPKQAFGTGHHITTQLVIEMMENIVAGTERILDIGTGSGILAMAGLRLGSREAIGIDTDPQAIQHAREYALVNNFEEELRFVDGPLASLPVEPYDLLVANIDRRTLMTLSKDLHRYSQPGGHLIISGILIEDAQEVTKALGAHHWSVVQSRQREEWAGLHLRLHAPDRREDSITQGGFPGTE